MKSIFTFFLIFIGVNSFGQNANYVINEMKANAFREQQAAANQLHRSTQLLSNAGSNFNVHYYNCTWEIDPAVKYIKGKVTSYFTVTSSTNTIVYDLMKNLTVDSVLYHNTKISYSQPSNNTISSTLPTTLAANKIDSITIFYQGIPNTSGNGSFSLSTHNGTPVLWTLSEPYGAKDWWPCKDGLTDKADSLDITVICPAAYRSSSNGTLQSEVVVGAKKIMQYKHRYPIVTYLVAIACTNYTTTSYNWNIGGTNIPYESWTYPESVTWFGNESYGIQNALTWFNDWIGQYPFANERYAHTQCNFGGGMEHQTNSFVGSPGHLLAAHELAHQWYGNKTTCGSWQHIWVNEGFASFMHWLYFEKHYPPTYNDIINEYHNEVTSDSSGSVFVPDTTDIGRIFSWRHTYVKGSYVLFMLRHMLGDATFFNAMKAFSNDPQTKYGFARTADVKRVFEQVTGKNLTKFFDQWIYGEGWPMHHINWYVNNNGYLNVQINQRQSHPSVSFFEVPLQVRFKNATQDTLLTFNLQQNGQVFSTKLNFTPDTALVNPKLHILSANNSQTKITVPNTTTNIVQVYPTPANNEDWKVVIKNPTKNNFTISLLNTLGQKIYTTTTNTTGGDVYVTLPSNNLAKGMYQIIIYADGTVLEQKKILK